MLTGYAGAHRGPRELRRIARRGALVQIKRSEFRRRRKKIRGPSTSVGMTEGVGVTEGSNHAAHQTFALQMSLTQTLPRQTGEGIRDDPHPRLDDSARPLSVRERLTIVFERRVRVRFPRCPSWIRDSSLQQPSLRMTRAPFALFVSS